jgi:hypothetical protein
MGEYIGRIGVLAAVVAICRGDANSEEGARLLERAKMMAMMLGDLKLPQEWDYSSVLSHLYNNLYASKLAEEVIRSHPYHGSSR